MENIWIWGPVVASIIRAFGFFVGAMFAALTLDKRRIEQEILTKRESSHEYH